MVPANKAVLTFSLRVLPLEGAHHDDRDYDDEDSGRNGHHQVQVREQDVDKGVRVVLEDVARRGDSTWNIPKYSVIHSFSSEYFRYFSRNDCLDTELRYRNRWEIPYLKLFLRP